MKKSLIALAVASAIYAMAARSQHTQDVSYDLRMPTGFPGDVNRTHPFNVVPGLMNSSVQAPRLFGDPVLIDTATNSYRGIVVGDLAAVTIDGIVVRPYPTQQTSGGMTSTIGTGAPATNQPVDVISEGYVMVKVNNGGTPTKKGAVYIWVAASSGNHVQGGFESVATGGSTAGPITNCRFNGPPGADGVTEMVIDRVTGI